MKGIEGESFLKKNISKGYFHRQQSRVMGWGVCTVCSLAPSWSLAHAVRAQDMSAGVE